MPKRSVTNVALTRETILAKAVDMASVDGLDGLTIGRLADANFMSKTGLFAQFGSKEELQLAVVESAREIFERHVMGGTGSGLARLHQLASAWLGYLEKSPFRGGCFFAAASTEVDDRPGRIRDRVGSLIAGWLSALEREADSAIERGEVDSAEEPGQIAFELHAFLLEANRCFQLHGDPAAFRRAELAIGRVLETAATPEGRRLLPE